MYYSQNDCMPLKPREYRQGIINKGFISVTKVKRTKGDDEKFQLEIQNALTPITTYVSRGTKPIDKNIKGKMKRQLFLPKSVSVESFVQCNPSYSEYVEYLFNEGILTRTENGTIYLSRRR